MITKADYQKMTEAFRANPAMRAASLAMSKHPLNEIVFDQHKADEGQFLFNHEIKTLEYASIKAMLTHSTCKVDSTINIAMHKTNEFLVWVAYLHFIDFGPVVVIEN